jgi:hypothetical protein
MSGSATSASWSEDDITTLHDFLLSKKATAGDGMSFKAVIWNEAATVVNGVPGLKGARKSNASCKKKYAKGFFPAFLINSILKRIFS